MISKTGNVALLIFLATVSSATAVGDDVLRLSSGELRVPLIELFTSEGCSSCPPADRWLGELKSDPGLWRSFTPVAFHVDYWDDLGWPDRFAQAEFTQRQRRHAEGVSTVYTPGVFRDGREWRSWRTGSAAVRKPAKVGDLVAQVDGDTIDVQYDPVDAQRGALTVHAAVLGMSLETQVRAGENKGRTLQHDFVALATTSKPLDRDGETFRTTLALPETDHNPGDRALIVWVSAQASSMPLQSTGGYLQAPTPQ